jgi:hypothetical protein
MLVGILDDRLVNSPLRFLYVEEAEAFEKKFGVLCVGFLDKLK